MISLHRRWAVKRLLLVAVFAALLMYADLPTRLPFPGYACVKLLIRTESGGPRACGSALPTRPAIE